MERIVAIAAFIFAIPAIVIMSKALAPLFVTFIKRPDQSPKRYKKLNLPNQNGFTLIEIVTVLVLLGVLASFVIPLFVDLAATAQDKALSAGISELNSRESLTWARIKMLDTGWTDDESLFSHINTDLGTEYRWIPAAKIDGGTLHFRTGIAELERMSSSNTTPGKWRIKK
jgi:prepilin-type N-terminal cleavage/methylation domain-containing protein